MTKQPSPKLDALRAMRERQYEISMAQSEERKRLAKAAIDTGIKKEASSAEKKRKKKAAKKVRK
jgi:hypothetical protein